MKSSFRIPNWIYECVLGLLILIAINKYFFPENPAFVSCHPHPYLFLILLIACRYGARSGVFTALLATAILWFWASPSASLKVWEKLDVTIVHGLIFFLTGGFFGHLRSTHIQREENLCLQVEKNEKRADELTKRNNTLQSFSNELESRILTDINSFTALYHISKNLERLDVSEICKNVPDIIARHLAAEQCSIYLFEDNVLRLSGSYGWQDTLNFRKTIPLDNSMIGLACSKKISLSVRDFLDSPEEISFMGESIMCAPLISTNGTLLGAINIESMPFLNSTHASMSIFKVLSEWISQALDNAMYFELVKSHSIEDELLEIYNRKYLNQRLSEEFARSKIYYLPLSLALIKIIPFESQNHRSRLEEIKVAVAYLRTQCRNIDILTRYTEEIQLAILMTTTSDEESIERTGQIEKELGSMLPKNDNNDRLKIGVASFAVEMESWEELIKNTEESSV